MTHSTSSHLSLVVAAHSVVAVVAGDEDRGEVRKLELLISILVFVMAACFFGELSYVKPPAQDVLKGMFIPKLSGQGATSDAIALLGALVMPIATCSILVIDLRNS
ncbi:hypothetical protein POM88_023959 [Heracleum sosnowskyi]|uniref:Uncharacterized protein n=1 Tax=Heracleum sosnowskyi TaxID=360622 RepID=A0AAD8MV49_9APIA|nr:hypothetical protein POM88_023959 [Heracleum sosnowskyi]